MYSDMLPILRLDSVCSCVLGSMPFCHFDFEIPNTKLCPSKDENEVVRAVQ